jgi:hypothetical protein
VAGLLVALSAMTACGGSNSLSREQYASRLSAMCDDFSNREQAIGDPQSVKDLVEKGPRVVEAFEQAIVEPVHELKAPDEISARASRLIDLTDQQRDVLRGLVAAAKSSDYAKVNELASKNATLNRQASSIAKKLGATSCANDQG